MPCATPFFSQLVQLAIDLLPIGAGGVLSRPVLNFFNDGRALGFVGGFFGFDLVQPGFHDLVCLVASFIKLAPHAMVRHAALVGLLPSIAQVTHGFLLLAPSQRLGHQSLRLTDQFFTNLVSAPFLPAFHLTGGRQRITGLGLRALVDEIALLFERSAQIIGSLGAGFTMAFGQLLLQF